MNRETWLNQLAERMAPKFVELEKPIPEFRVAVGWTSAGKTSKVGGECWHSSNSADRKFEILVAPILDNSMEVAAVLAHELCHAAAGFKHGHKGEFATLMAQLGMVRPYTSSVPGDGFRTWVQPFLDELGNIPHARIMLNADRAKLLGDDEGGEAEEGEGGSSNQKKKQTTRMLKACCAHTDSEGKVCGYTVRLTKKWAASMGAMCPAHGPMDIDGLEVDPDEEDEES